MIHREPRQDLRLDEDQVAKLALLAPGIQEVMNNLFKGIKDDRQPEIQIRVARILRVDQIEHILKHKAVPDLALDYTPGEDPVVVEFARFIQARPPKALHFQIRDGSRAVSTPLRDASLQDRPPAPQLHTPEAVIRAILFQLRKNPAYVSNPPRWKTARAALLEKALNAIEKGQRSEEARKPTQNLAALLRFPEALEDQRAGLPRRCTELRAR